MTRGRKNIKTIDLFAGAGGLTLGFEHSGLGYEPIFAVEFDPAAARTYKANFDTHVYDGPIEDVESFPDADLILGGPPCQGFSPLGRDRDKKSRGQMNALWREYIRAVKQVRPMAFLIENVPEFLASAEFEAFQRLMGRDKILKEYHFNYGVLTATDYGVPQRRRRGFVVATRGKELDWPPPPSHGPESASKRPYVTVRDAIGDLPFEPTDEDLQWKRNPRPSSIERYKAVPEGGNRFDLAENRPDLLPDCWRRKKTGTTDVFGRLWWDKPSLTIRTEFFKPEKGRYLHPEAHRPITHRDAARLQTFPDSFEFEGSKIEVARQIGNAVPPKLAEALAHHIYPSVA